MIIRTAQTDADWRQAHILLTALCAFEKSIRPQRKDFTLESNGPLNWVKKNVLDNRGVCLLAFDGSPDAIGYMAAWVESGDGLDQGDNQTGWIGDAFVQDDCRGKGVFSALRTAAIRHFQEIGISRISTDTLASNSVMQNVLEQRGFTRHKILYERDTNAS